MQCIVGSLVQLMSTVEASVNSESKGPVELEWQLVREEENMALPLPGSSTWHVRQCLLHVDDFDPASLFLWIDGASVRSQLDAKLRLVPQLPLTVEQKTQTRKTLGHAIAHWPSLLEQCEKCGSVRSRVKR